MISEELHDAIEWAYRIFPEAHLRPPIGVCKCGSCVSDADEIALARTPRRELSFRLIREFVNSAHGRNDHLLRHFLPRMFELMAQGENICNHGEASGFKGLGQGTEGLPNSNYREHWLPHEIAAIDAYYGAFFRHALTVWAEQPDDPDIGIDWVLESIAIGGGELRPLLATWETNMSRSATLHLALLLCSKADMLRSMQDGVGDKEIEIFFFPDYARKAQRELAEWLHQPEHLSRIDQAMVVETDEEAFDLLKRARAWMKG